jgi:membrane protease YdiL (CAAX protease family)
MATVGGEGPVPGEWRPPPEWAAPVPAPVPPPLPPPTSTASLQPTTRSTLVWETRFVMVAFLVPAVTGAAVALAQHVNGEGTVTRFPVLLPDNPVGNLVIGIVAYLSVAAMVPLALHLLIRTGQPPRSLGLLRPSLRLDAWPALGLIGASLGGEFVLALILFPLIRHSSLYDKTPVGHVPGYYVMYGLAISATTAVAEEVLVNGYLLTRLSQLGWTPQKALVLSLILRTSYHAYYGIGFILTVPFGYFVTRSFQKNGRLTRPIVTHFMFDAILITIAILT